VREVDHRETVAEVDAWPDVVMMNLEHLRTDDELRPRAVMLEDAVQDLATKMYTGSDEGVVVDQEGGRFAPVDVFFDGEEYWLADGFHRVAAAERAGFDYFQARVQRGGAREAIRFGLGANARDGMRRTNADKRHTVRRALADDEWRRYSDGAVAKLCGVSQPFVSGMRSELEESGAIEPVTERLGLNGASYRVEELPQVKRSKRTTTSSSTPTKKAAAKPARAELPAPRVRRGGRKSQATSLKPKAPIRAEAAPARPAPPPVAEAAEPRIPRRELGGVDAITECSDIEALVVREVPRSKWYMVAHEGGQRLANEGVMVLEVTKDLPHAVMHLNNARLKFRGVVHLQDEARNFHVWGNAPEAEVPEAVGSLDDLFVALGEEPSEALVVAGD